MGGLALHTSSGCPAGPYVDIVCVCLPLVCSRPAEQQAARPDPGGGAAPHHQPVVRALRALCLHVQ